MHGGQVVYTSYLLFVIYVHLTVLSWKWSCGVPPTISWLLWLVTHPTTAQCSAALTATSDWSCQHAGRQIQPVRTAVHVAAATSMQSTFLPLLMLLTAQTRLHFSLQVPPLLCCVPLLKGNANSLKRGSKEGLLHQLEGFSVFHAPTMPHHLNPHGCSTPHDQLMSPALCRPATHGLRHWPDHVASIHCHLFLPLIASLPLQDRHLDNTWWSPALSCLLCDLKMMIVKLERKVGEIWDGIDLGIGKKFDYHETWIVWNSSTLVCIHYHIMKKIWNKMINSCGHKL